MSYPSHFPIQKPPMDFVQWWEPYMIDQESGAHIGGHPEARRIWARKDEGRWTQRTYGTSARVAYSTKIFSDEYEAWKALGSPRRVKDFVSVAQPHAQQLELIAQARAKINQIGKAMPKIDAGAVALEDSSPRTIPDP